MLESVVIAGVLIVGLVIAGTKLSRGARLRRRIAAERTYPIAELPEDTVGCITGTIRALDDTLSSPLFERACVYYVAEVELDRDGGVPTIIARELRGVPFVVEDASGRAVIDPESAEVAIELDHEAHDLWGNVRGARRVFLMRAGQGEVANVDELWFREAAIEIGAQVSIVGSGVREPDPSAAPVGGYRGELPTRLRLTSSAAHRLVIARR
jgi:hypothetical protein